MFSGKVLKKIYHPYLGQIDMSIDENLLIATDNNKIKLWDLISEKEKEFPMHDISHIRIIKNIIAAACKGTIKLLDITSGRIFKEFEAYSESISNINMSYDEKLISTVVDSEKNKNQPFGMEISETIIKLWDVASGKLFKEFITNLDYLNTSIKFSLDNKLLAAASKLGFRLWEIASEKLLVKIDLNNSGIVAIDSNLKYIVKSNDRELTYNHEKQAYEDEQDKGMCDIDIWEISTSEKIKTLKGYLKQDSNNSIDITPDGKFLVLNFESQILLWDIEKDLIVRTFSSFPESTFKDVILNGVIGCDSDELKH